MVEAGGKFFLLSVIGLLVLLLSGVACRINEPVLPTWKVPLVIPLVEHQYTLDSLIRRDTTSLTTNPANGLIVYSAKEQLHFGINEAGIHIAPAAPKPLVIRIGEMHVPSLGGLATAFLTTPANSVIIPQGTIINFPSSFPSIENFEYIVTRRAKAELTVSNRMPVRINFPNLLMVHDSAGNTLGPFAISTLGAGETATATVRADGQQLFSSLVLDPGYITTAGSNGTSVALPETLVTAVLALRELTLQTARTAFIPEQLLSARDSASVVIDQNPSPNLFTSATFRQGGFSLSLLNSLNFGAGVRVEFPQIYNRANGRPLAITRFLQRGESAIETIDLSEDSLGSSIPVNELIIQTSISQVGTEGNTNGYRTFSAGDSVVALISMRPPPQDTIVVERATGILKPKNIEVSVSHPLEFGDLSTKFHADSVRLPDASLGITIEPQELPVSLSGTISLLDLPSGSAASLPLPFTMLGKDTRTILTFQGQTFVPQLESLVDATHRFPGMMKFTGQAVINPSGEQTTVTFDSTSLVNGELELLIPGNLGITHGVFADTATIDLGDLGNQLEKIDHLLLQYTVENGLPARVSISYLLLDSLGSVSATLPSSPIVLNPPPVTPEGFAKSSSTVSTSVAVTPADIVALLHATQGITLIHIDTPPSPGGIKFRTSDRLHINILASFQYRAEVQ